MKILMIEDNQSVAQMMGMFFQKEQWEYANAYDGEEGLAMFKDDPNSFDLITLDLNLPKMDGMEVATHIREISTSIPLIMLTARDTESDQVLGLDIGADDYVTKPFSPITLIARIKALHRRADISGEPEPAAVEASADFDVVTNHFKLSTKTREAYLDDQQIVGLTPKEFDLLRTLAQSPKQVFSREQLLQLVWEYEYYGDERTVDAHIKKLRQKIEKVGAQVIQTVWGVGYKFDDSGLDAK
ncbi:response regulator transcription factor [Lacticaseibacillus sharpeae]|uniref:DNA-binding response regulator, OmpR family (Rec-wHTH domains) n=1 Tax=Lacticaseibacillus sharpeae JCM 1186 = DSM 20505 TaxID=1291052 RepID=A0A0R1ZSW2_9LACO|nr:response regulator transcription factor [Lacticaseibacillus sharpeae]KRM54777.1 DNA-binding response regulator, OmpR family (Rec-wHTH domains) [Lacticaseibacillus sharpeae JCM 1186 = DSM 20505]